MAKRSASQATESQYRVLPVNQYAGVAAKERQRQRRERLIAAAFDLFSSAGYQATTIGALSEAANCSLRSFYEEFGTREALLGEMYDRVLSKVMSATIEAVETAGADPRDYVRAAVDAYVTTITADASHARIALIEAIGVSRDMDRRRRKAMQAFVRTLQSVIVTDQPAGDRGVEDLEIVVLALAGATDELVTEWILSKGRLSSERLLNVLYGIWMRGLRFSA